LRRLFALTSKKNTGDLNRVSLIQNGGVTGLGNTKVEANNLDHFQSQDQFFYLVLEVHFEDFKIPSFKKVGMKTYFVAEFEIAILLTAKDWPQKSNSLAAITAGSSNQLGWMWTFW
jgi:hypothetical protein